MHNLTKGFACNDLSVEWPIVLGLMISKVVMFSGMRNLEWSEKLRVSCGLLRLAWWCVFKKVEVELDFSAIVKVFEWSFYEWRCVISGAASQTVKTSTPQKMIPKPLRTLATGSAVILGGVLALNITSSIAVSVLRFATDLKLRRVAMPCGVCRGKGFYLCKLCKGNASINWSPLHDPIAINPCLCPTCDGNSFHYVVYYAFLRLLLMTYYLLQGTTLSELPREGLQMIFQMLKTKFFVITARWASRCIQILIVYIGAEDKNARVQNDCLLWWMPGPIDFWNDVIKEMAMSIRNTAPMEVVDDDSFPACGCNQGR
ncbi:unnamed protein product [Dovyalis caffra]|uniref:Uncharacterized protein n=1 Tax=Dovyalis caffra TaxID=77055 RepID=A0AAV1RFZ0_9ROSI|nr:unnamed protein product [Dovyalis caffra]